MVHVLAKATMAEPAYPETKADSANVCKGQLNMVSMKRTNRHGIWK